MKAQNKTVPLDISVEKFINEQNEVRQADCRVLLEIFKEVTGCPPVMWGTSIIGFDQYHYKYASGREGDFMKTGFAPRKQNLSIYILTGFGVEDLMKDLGKFKTGKSCLYVSKLSDINLDVLRKLIKHSIKKLDEKYPSV